MIDTPFAVINADDYYGKEGFKKVHDFLVEEHSQDDLLHFCMAGFILGNTLSENGGVTRGICQVDDRELLTSIVETISPKQQTVPVFRMETAVLHRLIQTVMFP